MRTDLRRQGLDDETIEGVVAREIAAGAARGEIGVFEVWRENAGIAEVFLSLATRWDVAVGLGGFAYLGLPRHEIEATLRMMRVTDRRQALSDLRVMEAGALEFLNQRD